MSLPSPDPLNQTDEIIAQLGAQISGLQRSLAERGRAIVEMDGEIRALKQAAAEYRRQMERERQLMEQERQFIVAMFVNSVSWRLTVPVRVIGGAFRKAKSFFLRILAISNEDVPGGPTPVLGPAPDQANRMESDKPLPGRLFADFVSTPRGRTEIVECAIQDILDRAREYDAVTDGYVHRGADRVDSTKLDVKAIAFYIPHFHPGCPEGAQWSKVVMAVPRYLGQYQPHFPGELGFYDLRLPEVMRQQIELARQYGIFGFCFLHRWSEGKDRSDLPLSQFLTNAELQMPFCLCWANGGQDELGFLDSIVPALSDRRYILINGKPLLIVEANVLADAARTAERWRKRAVEMGMPGLYLVTARSFDQTDPREIGFDAIVEYPMHEINLTDLSPKVPLIDPNFSGRVHSYPEMVEKQIRLVEPPFVNFKTVVTGWDNEARHPGAGFSFTGATPALYGQWLRCSCDVAMSRLPGERLIFINAWNDWTNGAHLEPDRRYGYAHLHVTANVLRNYHNDPDARQLVETTNAAFTRTRNVAIILHCHYEDLIEPLFDRYLSAAADADLFVTTRPDLSVNGINIIRRHRPNVFIQCVENRGRDIRPFLFALRRVQALGYLLVCKIHTKKASHMGRGLGEQWRQHLIDPLLGSDGSVSRVVRAFSEQSDLGVLAPKGSIMDLRRITANMYNTIWLNRLLNRMDRPDLIGNYGFQFPAGSMYWFRVAALAGLDDFVLAEDEFEEECGQTDGTLAHAVERLIALFAEQRGYRMGEISIDSGSD